MINEQEHKVTVEAANEGKQQNFNGDTKEAIKAAAETSAEIHDKAFQALNEQRDIMYHVAALERSTRVFKDALAALAFEIDAQQQRAAEKEQREIAAAEQLMARTSIVGGRPNFLSEAEPISCRHQLVTGMSKPRYHERVRGNATYYYAQMDCDVCGSTLSSGDWIEQRDASIREAKLSARLHRNRYHAEQEGVAA